MQYHFKKEQIQLNSFPHVLQHRLYRKEIRAAS